MIYCFYIIIVHYYINDKYYSVVVSCNVSTIVKKKNIIIFFPYNTRLLFNIGFPGLNAVWLAQPFGLPY